MSEPLEFFFNGQAVGAFEGPAYPHTAGRHPYMPYRSPGHLALGKALEAGRVPRCTLRDAGKTSKFTVLALEPRVIEIGPIGR
jgi:hypothetical protein